MTNDEIKKSLMICADLYLSCEDCPYHDDYSHCSDVLKNDARELIIKQEQEINFQVQDRARLQRELDELKQAHEQRVEEINQLKTECTLLDDELRNARQETINVLNKLKERIKTAIDTYYNSQGGSYYSSEDVIRDIDKLIEEQLKCPK